MFVYEKAISQFIKERKNVAFFKGNLSNLNYVVSLQQLQKLVAYI